MKLSSNSWHAWVYKMTYGWHSLPDNLCPYFWKFILGILLSLIMLPFHAVHYVISYTRGENDYEDGYFDKDNFGLSFAANLFSCCIIGMIGMWFSGWDELNFFNAFGVIGIMAGVVIFFAWAKEEEKWSEWFPSKKTKKEKEYKEKRPNIFIEFVKAKYNKYCPKINWKD